MYNSKKFAQNSHGDASVRHVNSLDAQRDCVGNITAFVVWPTRRDAGVSPSSLCMAKRTEKYQRREGQPGGSRQLGEMASLRALYAVVCARKSALNIALKVRM